MKMSVVRFRRFRAGEAIDESLHLIDLDRWFRGDFVDAQGAALTFYWNMPVGTMPFFYAANGMRLVLIRLL